MDGEGVPTLDGGDGTSLNGGRGTYLGWGRGYLHWMGKEYLLWMKYLLWMGGNNLEEGVPTLDGGGNLPLTGYGADGTPLEASHRRTFLLKVRTALRI